MDNTPKQQELFKLVTTCKVIESKDTCKECEHRQRWKCNSKVFQYCGVRKSNRTDNGLLKIRCKDKACMLFKQQLKD